MTERDAFGRPVGESQPSMPESRPTPAPAAPPTPPPPPSRPVTAAPPTPTPTTPRPTYVMPRGRTYSRGRWVVPLISLAVTLGGLAFAYSVYHDVSHSFDSFFPNTPSISTPSTPDEPSSSSGSATPSTPPVGLEHGSLMRPAGFGAALASIRRRAGGSPKLLRVDPTRVFVQVRTPHGALVNAQRTWNTSTEVISRSAGAGGPPTGLRWSQIDAAAPARIAKSVSGGSERPSRQVDYVVLLGGIDGWTAFRKDGRSYHADASGRHVTRTGG